jgi:Bacterial cadherin-like domain
MRGFSTSTAVAAVVLVLFCALKKQQIGVQADGNTFSNRITSGQVALYNMTVGQSDASAALVTPVPGTSAIGPLVVDRSAGIWTVERVGFSVSNITSPVLNAAIESGGTSQGFVDMVNEGNGFTIELQVTISNRPEAAELFSLSNYRAGFRTLATCSIGTVFSGLRVLLKRSTVNPNDPMVLSAEWATSTICIVATTVIDISSNVQQIVVRYDPTGSTPLLSLAVDGTTSGSLNSLLSTSAWTASKIQYVPLLEGVDERFAGQINLVAIYNRPLTDGELTTNRNAGRPNSRPYANPAAAAIAEDSIGEFDIVGLDDDSADTLTFTLLSMPDKGVLKFFNATQNAYISIPQVPFSAGTARRFSYQPPADQTGVDFTEISYVISDQRVISAVVTQKITVTPVNDPPVADSKTIDVSSMCSSAVALSATDIDSQTFSFTILTPPSNGFLYQTTDGLTPSGPRLNASDYPVTVSDSNGRLVFISNPPTMAGSGRDLLSVDSFTYNASDIEGATSLSPGTVTLRVLNFLQAANGTATVLEDVSSAVSVRPQNCLGSTVQVYISQLPSSGSLYITQDGVTPVNNGDLPLLVSAPYTLFYKSALNVYGTNIDKIGYFVRLNDASSSLNGFESFRGFEQVDVTQVNDPVVLALGPSDSDPIVVQINSDGRQFNYFTVVASDPDPDEAQWEVSYKGPFEVVLSLNETLIQYLDFDSTRGGFGDGLSDNEFVFFASKPVAIAALQNMLIQGQVISDVSIEFKVNDRSAASGGAQTTTFTLSVQVIENEQVEAANEVLPVSMVYLTWAALIMLPVGCCVCYCCGKHASHDGKVAKHLPRCFKCIAAHVVEEVVRRRRGPHERNYRAGGPHGRTRNRKGSDSSDSDSEDEHLLNDRWKGFSALENTVSGLSKA